MSSIVCDSCLIEVEKGVVQMQAKSLTEHLHLHWFSQGRILHDWEGDLTLLQRHKSENVGIG